MREVTPGRVITVFGCGGDRDPDKRPLMGAAAGGCRDHRRRHERQPAQRGPGRDHPADRGRAARAGARLRGRGRPPRGDRVARSRRPSPGDAVLIAGKGHEDYQIFADRTDPLRRPRGRARGAGARCAERHASRPSSRSPAASCSSGSARRVGQRARDRLARRRARVRVRGVRRRARRRARLPRRRARRGRARARRSRARRRAADACSTRRRGATSRSSASHDALAALQDLAAWHRVAAARARSSASPARPARRRPRTSSPRVLATELRVVATAGQPQQRARRAAHGARGGSRHRRARRRDGHARARADRASSARSRGRRSGWSPTWARATSSCSARRRPIASAKGELVRAIPADGAVFLNGDDAYSRVARRRRRAAPVDLLRARGAAATCAPRTSSSTTTSRAVVHAGRAGGSASSVALAGPGPAQRVQRARRGRGRRCTSGCALERIAEGLADGERLGDAHGGRSTTRERRHRRSTTRTTRTRPRCARRSRRSPTMRTDGTPGRGPRRHGRARLADRARALPARRARRAPARSTCSSRSGRARRASPRARAAEGMAAERVRACATADEAAEVLDDVLEPGDVVLVKASRVMGLERVVEGIVKPRVVGSRSTRPTRSSWRWSSRWSRPPRCSRSGSGCCGSATSASRCAPTGRRATSSSRGRPRWAACSSCSSCAAIYLLMGQHRRAAACSRSCAMLACGLLGFVDDWSKVLARALARAAAAGEAAVAGARSRSSFGLLAVNWVGTPDVGRRSR